ncbi:MAG TPA: wax ester/triacylglycerol synthase domain-containing protein [Euzebyales bacterium]
MDRLSADDRLILWPDEVWPQDVGALAILEGSSLLDADGGVRIDAARDAVGRRIHLVPRFRQVLHVPRRGLGGPLWVDAPAFDLREHVRVAPVVPPGGDAQLLETVEQIRRRRLDRSRPLWEMWLLPGLPARRIGMFVRLHHVVADGLAGIASVAALLGGDADATAASTQPWVPAAWPSSRALLGDNLRRRAAGTRRAVARLRHPGDVLRGLRGAWPAAHELLVAEPGPQTSLGRVIGPHRRLALVRGRLDVVRDVARAQDATVNDVLLTVATAGLRRLLARRAEPVDDVVVPVYVPVSLRREHSGQAVGNLITQMVVPLPLDIADAGQRLRHIAAETARRKAMVRPPLGAMFRSRPLAGVMLKLVARQRVNVVTADLPGPPAPLSFAGARLLEVFPLVNLIGTVSLGVAALSYAGQFNLMVVADADAYPDLDVFVAAVEDELRATALR